MRCTGWFSLQNFLTISGTKRSSFLLSGYLGLKCLGREADSPPPSVVEAMNEYTYMSTSSVTSWHVQKHLYLMAASWLGRLVADFSLRMPGVGFMKHTMALGRGFLRAFRCFLYQYPSTDVPCSPVMRLSLTPCLRTLLLLLLLLLTVVGLSPGDSSYFTCIQNMKLITNKFK